MTSSKPNTLLVGYGQLGKGLATRLQPHHTLYAIQRSLPTGMDNGVQRLQADLQDMDTLSHNMPENLHFVVIALSPGGRSEEAYRAVFLDGLSNLLRALQAQSQLQHILFVSSTSVYHQNDGSWIDELSPTEPAGFAGRLLLQAEQIAHQCEFPASIVRFSGIYGGQRHRLLKSIVSGEMRPGLPAKLSNRIHEEDCIGILAHLLNCAIEGKALHNLYLASDDSPVSLNAVIAFIRQELGLPELEPSETATQSRRGGNKRCSNRRIKDAGYRFLFPTYREGYREQINRHHAMIEAWLTR